MTSAGNLDIVKGRNGLCFACWYRGQFQEWKKSWKEAPDCGGHGYYKRNGPACEGKRAGLPKTAEQPEGRRRNKDFKKVVLL